MLLVSWFTQSGGFVFSHFFFPPRNSCSTLSLKGYLYCDAKWNVKFSESLQSRKTNVSFFDQAWILRMIMAPSGWSQKSSTKCTRSSLILPPSPPLSPPATLNFEHSSRSICSFTTRPLNTLFYCLAFPLPPRRLQDSANVCLLAMAPTGPLTPVSPGGISSLLLTSQAVNPTRSGTKSNFFTSIFLC